MESHINNKKTRMAVRSMQMRVAIATILSASLFFSMILSACNMKKNTQTKQLSEIFVEKDIGPNGISVEEELRNHVDDGVPMDPGLVFEIYQEAFATILGINTRYEGKNVAICTGYNGENTDVRIPNTFNGMPVVAIDGRSSNSGNNFSSLTKIEMPDSITVISNEAFADCNLLESVKISARAKEIPRFAFKDCTSLRLIDIPNGVIEITDGAFTGCTSLTDMTIPQIITKIGDGAFAGCTSLTNITIPDSVLIIGQDAFKDCRSLTGVNTKNGIILPKNLTSLGDRAFYGCALPGKLIIPDSVKTISYVELYNLSENVKLSESESADEFFRLGKEHSLGLADFKDTFFGCKLTEVQIGKGMQMVGGFGGNPLTSIDIPDWVLEIDANAFTACPLKNITIPDSVQIIGEGAFADCESLTSVTLPAGLEKVGNDMLIIVDHAFCNTPIDPLLIQKIQFVNKRAYQKPDHKHSYFVYLNAIEEAAESEQAFIGDILESDLYEGEQSQEDRNDALTQENIDEFPAILLDYYHGYLASINQQDISYVQHATPAQQIRLADRIYSEANREYIFTFDQIIIDADTIEFLEDNDTVTLKFYAAFQFATEPRHEKGGIEHGASVQLVNMIYYKRQQSWLVDSSEIVNGITIGSNQMLL